MDASVLGRYESLGALTDMVAKQSKIIQDALKSAGQDVSIRDSDPLAYPMETNRDQTFQRARLDLMEAARQIQELMMGPTLKAWYDTMSGYHLCNTLRIFHLYKVPENVPLDRSISYADLSRKVNIDQDKLTRLIQYAMTRNYFHQPSPNHVAHTSSSLLLATDPMSRDAVGHFLDDVFPAAASMPEAWQQFGSATNDLDKTALVVAPHNPNHLTLFEFFAAYPEREKRFGGAMQWWSTRLPNTLAMSTAGLGSTFDWNSLGAAKVVDCGGSRGHTMFELLQTNPAATAIVEDLPSVIEAAQSAELPDTVDKSRLTFKSWDFFAEAQPVRDADAYLFRTVFHDWTDKDSYRILANLVPYMKKGAKLIINEVVVDEPGEKSWQWESLVRQMDMQMMVAAYSRERTARQWKEMVDGAMEALGEQMAGGKLELQAMGGNFMIYVKM